MSTFALGNIIKNLSGYSTGNSLLVSMLGNDGSNDHLLLTNSSGVLFVQVSGTPTVNVTGSSFTLAGTGSVAITNPITLSANTNIGVTGSSFTLTGTGSVNVMSPVQLSANTNIGVTGSTFSLSPANMTLLTGGIVIQSGNNLIGASRIQDNTTGYQATVAAFHNTDNQSFGANVYGLMGGGVTQLLNYASNLDRQRETGVDNIPAVGIVTGAQQLASPFSTTCTTTIPTGSQTVTPAAMSGTSRGSAWSIQIGTVLTVDTGSKQEPVVVTATGSTTFTAIFTKTHTNPWTINGYVYNQARDATTSDGANGMGFAAGATYLLNTTLNSANGGWEGERSAAGEMDGATGVGTALAAGYEWNAGGPIVNGGAISGFQFDRERNIQGKGLGTTTLNGATVAGATLFTGTAVTGLNPGQQIIIDPTGTNPEAAYVSTTYAGGTAIAIQGAGLSYAHSTGATLQWDVFSAIGPGTNGFTMAGMGIEEEALYDPVTKLSHLAIAATADAVAGANVPMESVGLYNGATFDRLKDTLVAGAANVSVANFNVMGSSPVTGDKTITSTAATLFAGGSQLANRYAMTVYNESSSPCYWGPSGITTLTGFTLQPGDSITFTFNRTVATSIYFIATASMTVRVSEFA